MAERIVKKTSQKLKATTKKTAIPVKKTEHRVEDAENKKKAKRPNIAANIMGQGGQVLGKINLPGEIFNAEINQPLMAQAVRVYLANQRSGTSSTKTRGEVQGSTRKIYRQKGTGRARHGGIRAPIFVGGGIAFGPNPRDLSLHLPKKMRRRALFSALSAKCTDHKVIITDAFDLQKTKDMQKALVALNVVNKKKKADKVLFVIAPQYEQVQRAARNLSGIDLAQAAHLNTYEVLRSKYIIFMKDSVDVIKKTFLGE